MSRAAPVPAGRGARSGVRRILPLAIVLALLGTGSAADAAVTLTPTQRIPRKQGLELRFRLPAARPYALPYAFRGATLRLKVPRRSPALRLTRLRGERRLDRPPLRGSRRGRIVRFDLARRLVPGTRVRLLVSAKKRRKRPRVGGARLRLVEPSAVTQPPVPTPSPSPAPASATVWAVGDAACDPAEADHDASTGLRCRQRAVSDLMLADPADALLALGDLQYEQGTLANFMGSYDPTWGRLKAITHPVVGNHEYDDPGPGAPGYFDYFNGVGAPDGSAGPRDLGYYSFELGSWHLVALNSNCSEVSCAATSPQLDWLRADLAAHPARCVLAFFHHPRFSARSANSSVAPFWDALHAAGADVVLAGHAHFYERHAPQTPAGAPDPAAGIRQFIVGTGGHSLQTINSPAPTSELVDNTTFGALRLTLGDGGYDWEFRGAAGGTFTDAGTGACH
jgi:acid phosphatase type 7